MANLTDGGKPGTAGTLKAALKILQPGEIADPHRHSLAAKRVVTSAAGGYTTVNETRCRMEEDDLNLTIGPALEWLLQRHADAGHVGRRPRRAARLSSRRNFFRASWPATPKLVDAVEFDEAAWSSGGLIAPAPPRSENYSPKFRYDWRSRRRALDGLAPAADGSRLMRYVNPLTGGAVMPTIDCYALKLAARQETIPRRSTSSAICVVIAGEGHTAIGNETIHWAQNDVFNLPHWQWASHVATNGDADPRGSQQSRTAAAPWPPDHRNEALGTATGRRAKRSGVERRRGRIMDQGPCSCGPSRFTVEKPSLQPA